MAVIIDANHANSNKRYLEQIRIKLKGESKGRKLFCGVDKPVHIDSYLRIRFGRIEIVCEHCRSNWGSKHAA